MDCITNFNEYYVNGQLFIYDNPPFWVLLMVGNPNDVILISIYWIFIVCLQKTGSIFSRDFKSLLFQLLYNMVVFITINWRSYQI
jgi:hypothetical protein